MSQYQKRALAALESIKKYCKLEHGYAGIQDVRLNTQKDYINQTETFFFAEVLKYLYLTFADPNIIHLDEWVVSLFLSFSIQLFTSSVACLSSIPRLIHLLPHRPLIATLLSVGLVLSSLSRYALSVQRPSTYDLPRL